MKPLDTHAPKHADTAITRLKLKDQLAVNPYKGLALLESTLLCLVTTALMLFVAQSVGITDTFKGNVLYSGTLGACIGATYWMYHDAALSEWSIARHISPTALQNAMLALKYSETQEGVYYTKKRMFTPIPSVRFRADHAHHTGWGHALRRPLFQAESAVGQADGAGRDLNQPDLAIPT
ncbi:hypothetical protein [Pseudomonas sp. Irchel 3H9]|uniref:hypothetical protein n=1 Tax=Pseudomonas sp. Irchel 3H9 TaxID=2009043 RepID=UPI000BA4D27D|nr:hypothetical protein [Pseudomonas sp. Irchel 3H9]